MDGFDDKFVMNMNMSDRCCYVILDTSVGYNKSIGEIWWRFDWDIVKVTNMSFDAFATLFVRRMERKIN